MSSKWGYKFESFDKLKIDLESKIQEISVIEQYWIALAYINSQSVVFVDANKVIDLLPEDIFSQLLNKARQAITNNKKALSVISILNQIIPDGEESSGWEFDFLQNTLISFLTFFEFIIQKERFLFVDLIISVITNADIIRSETEAPVDERAVLNEQITMLYSAIDKIKILEDKDSIVNFLKKLDIK